MLLQENVNLEIFRLSEKFSNQRQEYDPSNKLGNLLVFGLHCGSPNPLKTSIDQGYSIQGIKRAFQTILAIIIIVIITIICNSLSYDNL